MVGSNSDCKKIMGKKIENPELSYLVLFRAKILGAAPGYQ
jgi:hypothetical protein